MAHNGRYEYVAGLDIGNGYVKGMIDHVDGSNMTVVDMPSAVTRMTRPNQMTIPDDDAPDVVADDFFNSIDATYSSPMVGDNYRRLSGKRSLVVRGGITDEFDLVGNLSKAQQELSKVLVLSTLAAKAVTDYVSETGHLPRPDNDDDPAGLRVSVVVALALPINEYLNHRDSYAASFTGGSKRISHTVTVGNFDTPVSVTIVFKDVRVIAEGASAQYAITAGGPKLMEGMLADVRSHGVELPGITSVDVLAATNTIGVDIGEGTVNFPVFTDAKFNADASKTFEQGYGTVLENALESMTDAQYRHGFTTRKQLSEFLQTPPSPLKRANYDRVASYVQQEAEFFAQSVTEAFGHVLAYVGARTEVAYVFGGGSGPMRDVLYPMLLNKAREMNSHDAFPVMYLDAQYSRKLNREGLMVAARTLIDNPKRKKK